MKRHYFTLIILLLISTFTAFAQENWQLRKDKDGIQVYSGEIAGSNIRAIKVITTYDATIPQIVNEVMDVNTAKQWVTHLKTNVLVKQVSPNELYYYSEVNMPWPVTNRDFVAHLIVSHDRESNATIIDGPAVSGFIPEKKGTIRITNSTGRWVITPAGNNQVKVEYTMHVDPAGSLPSWLVNLFSAETPFEIFKNLRVQLQKPLPNKPERVLASNLAER